MPMLNRVKDGFVLFLFNIILLAVLGPWIVLFLSEVGYPYVLYTIWISTIIGH